MKILIVEDEKKTAAYLRRGLTENGCAVDVAADGQEGLRLALGGDYDLVILDIELPDTDGFNVTRQLKALPRPPLVVLLSVHSDVHSKTRGVQAGCDAFVEKGLGWPGLLA